MLQALKNCIKKPPIFQEGGVLIAFFELSKIFVSIDFGSHRGIRTPVTAVRGRRPEPLDDMAINMAAGPGFEPGQHDPESWVLPLHNPAAKNYGLQLQIIKDYFRYVNTRVKDAHQFCHNPQVLQLPPLQEPQEELPELELPLLIYKNPVNNCCTLPPHSGQVTLSLFFILTNSLKRWPHFLHSKSKVGMITFPPLTVNICARYYILL